MITVTAKNYCLTVADKRLNTPEIITIFVKITARFDQLIIYDLQRSHPPGVIREVSSICLIRVCGYFVDSQISKANRKRLVMRLRP